MTLKDVMTRNVDVLEPWATLAEAAQLMRDRDIGAIPVCDGSRIEGLLTDRDLVVRGIAVGLEGGAPVERVMTPRVEWLFEDHDVAQAAELMQRQQIRRVVVVDRNKRLVGIVSLGDIARRLHDHALEGETIEAISQPGRH